MYEKTLIRQGVELVGTFKSDMTYCEMMLYYSIVKHISREDTNFKEITIPISEFIEDWNKNQKNVYKQVDEAIRSLVGRKIAYNDNHNGKRKIGYIVFITQGEYIEGDGCVKVKINESMKPFLLQLKEKYVSLDIKNLSKLPNHKSIWLYEIMKQWQDIGTITTTFDFLKQLYGEKEGQTIYERASDFSKRVINPAVESINENSDISVTVQTIGRGKQTKWVFNIEKKWKNEKEHLSTEEEELFERLWQMYPRKKGKSSVSKKTKRELLEVGEEELIRCIERYKAEIKDREIDYVLHGSTFFNGRYKDYLDENYQQEKTDITNPNDDKYLRYKDCHTIEEAMELAKKYGDI